TKTRRIKVKKTFSESRIVPLVVISLCIVAVLFISLKITSYGYIPGDDAMRHVAKAISGLDWDKILVIREDIKMDSHPGWHAILTVLYRATNCSADDLMAFSVVSLFLIFCFVPLFFLERPESWILALLAVSVTGHGFIFRLTSGRPYIFTMSTVLIFGFLWPRFRDKKIHWPSVILMTISIAVSTWVHGLWYMFALPIACLFAAREWRPGIIFSACAVSGIAIGASFTGRPFLFLGQILNHSIHSFSGHAVTRMLVVEFQPSDGTPLMVAAVLAMLGWRALRNSWSIKTIDNPLFFLGAAGWVSGLVVYRSWLDWGMPAISAWMALEFQDFFTKTIGSYSWRRVGTVFFAGITLFLVDTSDLGGRWTNNLTIDYVSSENPDAASWLPEADGVVYLTDMTLFYQTFYKNPKARWRYILGFEPTWMKPDDLAIFRNILWNYGAFKSFEEWVKKMRPQDRLIVRHPSGKPPAISGLEWYYAATDTWIGRLPKNISK
ncbi:MAG: hypothetical protein NTY34_01200, partial [Candidatus Omnitrophica bacterium]|nr:hypothetical protein [Candidatus Omnitrophota bacterium]